MDYHLPVRVEYYSLDAVAREELTKFINISEDGGYLPLSRRPDSAQPVKLKILAPDELSKNFFHPNESRKAGADMQMIIMAHGSIVRAVEDPARPKAVCIGVQFQESIRITWEEREEANPPF